MAPDLLILGQLTIDHVVPAEPGPWHVRLGGNALYAAAGARLWCEPSRIGVVARRGANMPSTLDEVLETAGLTTAGIVPVPVDNMVEWLIYEVDGSRRNLPRAPELRDPAVDAATREARYIARKHAVSPSHEDIPPAWLPNAAIHLAPQVGNRHQTSIAALSAQTGLLSVDPSPTYSRALTAEHLFERLRGVHIFMPSAGEIAHLAPSRDWRAVAQHLRSTGFPEVVIKLGQDGVAVAAGACECVVVPAMRATPVDLTGAGDAFCGAFLACRLRGMNPLESARRAGVAAAMVVECAGVEAALGLKRSRAAAMLIDAYGPAA